MTDDAAIVGAGLAVAAALDLPLRVAGALVRVPPGAVPELEPVTDEQAAAHRDLIAQSAKPDIEVARRLAYCLAAAGHLMSPIVDAVAGDTPANTNTAAAPATIDAEPPPLKEPAASVAWATTADRLASAPDATPWGSNCVLIAGSVLVERRGNEYLVRRRYADVSEAKTATSEAGALTLARRVASATTDGDTQ